jgi:hypothetical protein
MTGPLRRRALALAPLALLASPAQAAEKDWNTASDVAVGALIAWSAGVPLVEGDEKGALQAGVSIAAAQGVAQLLKHTVRETRPDGSDRQSFPSAHAATAFAAATSIYERRGAGEGIPALALAGLTGLGRVEARRHHWHDVLAGAAIGGLSGLVLTHPARERGMTLAAWGDTGGGGVSFAMGF